MMDVNTGHSEGRGDMRGDKRKKLLTLPGESRETFRRR